MSVARAARSLTNDYGQDITGAVVHPSLDITLPSVPTEVGREFDLAMVSRADGLRDRQLVTAILTLGSPVINIYNS